MKKDKKRTIFNNHINDEYMEEIRNYCIERHLEECPDDKEWKPSADKLLHECLLQEANTWDDFSYEFKKFVEKYDFPFILQGKIGRWDGVYDGGCVFHSFSEISNIWNSCDYINIYDENGHLYIKCTHHDGTNAYEIRALNEKGYEYYNNNNNWMSNRELHNKLMKAPYSILPNYAKTVFG